MAPPKGIGRRGYLKPTGMIGSFALSSASAWVTTLPLGLGSSARLLGNAGKHSSSHNTKKRKKMKKSKNHSDRIADQPQLQLLVGSRVLVAGSSKRRMMQHYPRMR
jgi:hypothetical protein